MPWGLVQSKPEMGVLQSTIFWLMLVLHQISEKRMFLHSLVHNYIRNNFLILSCTPFSPSKQLQLVEARTLKVVESVPQGCWPMLTPMLPTVGKLAGCPLGDVPFLIHMGNCWA